MVYNHQTTPHISYIYIIIRTLGYKIKSLTLLKQITFRIKIRTKLAGLHAAAANHVKYSV